MWVWTGFTLVQFIRELLDQSTKRRRPVLPIDQQKKKMNAAQIFGTAAANKREKNVDAAASVQSYLDLVEDDERRKMATPLSPEHRRS